MSMSLRRSSRIKKQNNKPFIPFTEIYSSINKLKTLQEIYKKKSKKNARVVNTTNILKLYKKKILLHKTLIFRIAIKKTFMKLP